MARQRLYVNDRGDCVINDSGFSWFAALASPVWALHRRLYLLAVILVVAGVISNVTDQITQWVIGVAQFVLLGSLGNRIHRWLLEHRGWRVTAEEPEQSTGGT
jgi:lipoprotein signal peptidase